MRGTRCMTVLALLFSLSGCLQFEMTLQADNSGTFVFEHPATNLEEFKRRASSPAVTVVDGTLNNGRARINAKFSDVTKLNTTDLMRDVVVTVEKDEKGQSKFVGRLNNSFAKKTPESVLKSIVEKAEKDAKIEITFPGEVVETNATTKEGRKASWVIPTKEMVYAPLIRFEATYK